MGSVSEWLFFIVNSALCQLYHGEHKLIFNELMMRSALYYINTLSWIYSASSLKQQSAARHVSNSFNINKTNNHLSPQIIEHIKDHLHDVWNACPGLDSNYSRIKLVNIIPTLPSCIHVCTIYLSKIINMDIIKKKTIGT